MSRVSTDFDYRRQKFHIYFAHKDSATIVKQYLLWLSKYYTANDIDPYKINWFIAVPEESDVSIINKLHKDINVIVAKDKPMEELFKTYPVNFNQDIYILVWDELEPPDFWTKIFTELYLAKLFVKPLLYFREQTYKIPVCLGKHLKDNPKIIQRKLPDKCIDMSKVKNRFRLII